MRRNDHEERCSDANQHIRPKAGGFVAKLSFEPDRPSEERGKKDLQRNRIFDLHEGLHLFEMCQCLELPESVVDLIAVQIGQPMHTELLDIE